MNIIFELVIFRNLGFHAFRCSGRFSVECVEITFANAFKQFWITLIAYHFQIGDRFECWLHHHTYIIRGNQCATINTANRSSHIHSSQFCFGFWISSKNEKFWCRTHQYAPYGEPVAAGQRERNIGNHSRRTHKTSDRRWLYTHCKRIDSNECPCPRDIPRERTNTQSKWPQIYPRDREIATGKYGLDQTAGGAIQASRCSRSVQHRRYIRHSRRMFNVWSLEVADFGFERTMSVFFAFWFEFSDGNKNSPHSTVNERSIEFPNLSKRWRCNRHIYFPIRAQCPLTFDMRLIDISVFTMNFATKRADK